MEKARVHPTLIGGVAILMWAALAVLTAQTGEVPPFLLVALSFTLAFVIGVAFWLFEARHEARKNFVACVVSCLKLPIRVWVLGVLGLFGYHLFYFVALRNAPPVEASLIAYLWPLLIVVFSALLPGEKLRWWHLVGTAVGLLGTFILITGGEVSFKSEFALGYAAAAVCALTWSCYSVLSRIVRQVPTSAIGGFCGVTALFSYCAHFALETTVWPAGYGEWFAVIGLGLGPVGAAFYFWDHGVKHGDIRILGASSYLSPLISTVILIVVGIAEATWQVGIACLMITGGAALAAREMIGFHRFGKLSSRDDLFGPS